MVALHGRPNQAVTPAPAGSQQQAPYRYPRERWCPSDLPGQPARPPTSSGPSVPATTVRNVIQPDEPGDLRSPVCRFGARGLFGATVMHGPHIRHSGAKPISAR